MGLMVRATQFELKDSYVCSAQPRRGWCSGRDSNPRSVTKGNHFPGTEPRKATMLSVRLHSPVNRATFGRACFHRSPEASEHLDFIFLTRGVFRFGSISAHTRCRTVQSATGKIVFVRLDQSVEVLIWPDMNGKGNGREW